jgi:hypothetical protein
MRKRMSKEGDIKSGYGKNMRMEGKPEGRGSRRKS